MMKNERGFTIMELLVVIVIIGVLAAIGVPAYNNMTTRARQTACQANQRTLQAAVGMYYVDTGDYPGGISDLEDYVDNAGKIKCPVATNSYSINETTHLVECSDSDHNPPSGP